MRPETGSEDQAGEAAKASWSLLYIMIFPIASLSFLYFVDSGSFFGFNTSLLCIIIVFVFYTVSLAIGLISRRFRHSFSISCGFLLGILVIWNSPTILDWKRSVEFFYERPEFDELVRIERDRIPASEPIRMVVKVEDQSLIAISNLFFRIIYDETDEAIRNPESVRGYWRYPKSETGIISVGGEKTIEHLSGHYYRFWTND